MFGACQKMFFLGMCALSTHPVMAATQTVTAHIAFAMPASVTKNTDIDFGAVRADAPTAYTITPGGVVSAPGARKIAGGAPVAGSILIMGTKDQRINISVTQYADGGGVSPQNATCAYGDRLGGHCEITDVSSPPGKGTALLLGVQAVMNGAPSAAAKPAPSFTVTVAYQ